jgi:multidrug efflux pump subunit AcrB
MIQHLRSNRSEVFVQLRYEFSEPLSLARKERVITSVEQILEPHREEMKAKHVYSFWSDRFSLTRIYMEEGHSNDRDMAETRATLREVLPEIPGVSLMVQDQGMGGRHGRGSGKSIAFQLVGEDSGVLSELADDVRFRLREIPGLVDSWASSQSGGWSSLSTSTASWPRSTACR